MAATTTSANPQPAQPLAAPAAPPAEHPIWRLLGKTRKHVLGMMSGTSGDGLDCALTVIAGHGLQTRVLQVQSATLPYSAAQREFIAASAVSKRLGLLEESLGVELLVRHGGRLSTLDLESGLMLATRRLSGHVPQTLREPVTVQPGGYWLSTPARWIAGVSRVQRARVVGATADLPADGVVWSSDASGDGLLLAEPLFGVPAYGTMAHSFIQAHEDETLVFERFARARPEQVTLLLDTYDTEAAARPLLS